MLSLVFIAKHGYVGVVIEEHRLKLILIDCCNIID